MNKQEIEKAIKLLQTVNHNLKVEHMTKDMSDGTTSEERKEYREDFRLINVTISELEKQIPKKPIEEQGISPRCPYCDNANYLTNEDEEDNNCCGNCGQAIDWEGEDE